MSENKLKKRIIEAPRVEANNLAWKPIVLTDSKGGSVKRESRNIHQIQWEIKIGATTRQYEQWIKRNISLLQRRHNKVHLYLWTGTCDFTDKVNKFIYLNSNVEEAVREYRDNIESINRLVKSCDNVRLTFLPIPYLSIEAWNRAKGHNEPDIFKEQDKILTGIIDSENCLLKEKNKEGNTYAPNLNADLVRSRKAKGKKQRYSLNLSLLPDGVHPGVNIAKVWGINISRCIVDQCK